MAAYLDAWLAEHDLSGVPEEDWGATARVGMGIYYFEEIVPQAESAP